jgi:hypothetical protein
MHKDYPAISVADMEQIVSDASYGAHGIEAQDTPVSIHVHSVRKRLTDADGVSAKAVIDALVADGLLKNDSPEFVKEVRYSQEKGETEYTVITIEAAIA